MASQDIKSLAPELHLLLLGKSEGFQDFVQNRSGLNPQLKVVDMEVQLWETLKYLSIHLIVLNIETYGEDGVELIMKLKRHPGHCSVPILLLLAPDQHALVQPCIDAGAIDYLTLPLVESLAITRIEAIFHNEHKIKQLRESHQELQFAHRHLQDELAKEKKKRQDLEAETLKFRELFPAWQRLPRRVQAALGEFLSAFSKLSKHSSPELHQIFIEITHHYCDILGEAFDFNQLANIPNTVTNQSRLNLLRHAPLFKGLSNYDLMMLANNMTELSIEPNTNILTQGESFDHVHLIASGTVEVWINHELITHGGVGDLFGERHVISSESKAQNTVRAIETCQTLAIEKDTFYKIIIRIPKLWRNLFQQKSTQLKIANQRISELLQHFSQGLLKVDPKGVITKEFSRKCCELFNSSQLLGKPADDCLFVDDPKHIDEFSTLYPLFFQTDHAMDFEEIANLLPEATKFMDAQGNLREYSLSYYPCVDLHDHINYVDIGIEDVTHARELARKNVLLEQEKRRMRVLYDNPEHFLRLLNLVEEIQDTLHKLVTQGTVTSQTGPQLEETQRQLHTLKGMCGMLEQEALQNSCHQLEHCLGQMTQEDTEHDSTPTGGSFNNNQAFDECWQQFLSDCDSIRHILDGLGSELKTRLLGIVLTKDGFEHLKTAIKDKNWQRATRVIETFDSVPAKTLIRKWSNEAQRLAESQGKQVQVRAEGEAVRISRRLFDQLEASLIHVLRNCITHGLESPTEREQADKPSSGQIVFRCLQKNDQIEIEISDDGYGIRWEEIIHKATHDPNLNQQLIKEYLDADQPWKILFLPGFSNTVEATALAGRGFGLNALKTKVTEEGGDILVKSAPNQGTTFILVFPAYSTTVDSNERLTSDAAI